MNPTSDDVYDRYLELQRYVEWTEEDAHHVRSLAAEILPHLPTLVDDFYAEIERHPEARKAVTGGDTQIQRLKSAISGWMRELITGPYDREYVLCRWWIGQRHLEIGLDQIYVQAALARLRAGLLRALEAGGQIRRSPIDHAALRSLNLLLDLELVTIQDAYHREHLRLVEEQTRVRGELAFRAMLEAAPCVVVIVTAPDQMILYFNPFAERVTGYTTTEALGRNITELLDGTGMAVALAREPEMEFESSMRCKDGTHRWVVWDSERVEFRGGPATLIVGLDRTDLRELQDRAARAERLAELGVLASGLAHEIRNPLNTIRFNLHNIQDAAIDPACGGEMTSVVNDLTAEVNRLEGTLREFLRLARPDPARVEVVDIQDLLGSIARLVAGPCRADGVELLCDCPPNTLAAADPNHLKQVLLNLVINAQQAMPRGGRLWLRCLSQPDEIVIEVADSGAGIPDDIRDKVFSPFFSTKTDGTGLGLSICRRLVEDMHGRIDFVTQPGGGTTFTVRLPRAARVE